MKAFGSPLLTVSASLDPEWDKNYKGRKPKFDPAAVFQLQHDEKLGPAAIVRRLGLGRASVYRELQKQAEA